MGREEGRDRGWEEEGEGDDWLIQGHIEHKERKMDVGQPQDPSSPPPLPQGALIPKRINAFPLPKFPQPLRGSCRLGPALNMCHWGLLQT